jgi:hypothetical protein
MQITLSINTSQLANLRSYVETVRKKLLLVGKQTAFNEAKRRIKSHEKTGRLTSSLEWENIPTGVKIYNDRQSAFYAIFVHDGTRPHLIPKHPMPNPITGKKALRWVGKNGLPAFARQVRHPGYKGDPWMQFAMDKAFEAMKNVKL